MKVKKYKAVVVPNKKQEVSASTLMKLASGHAWFAKTNYQLSRNRKLNDTLRIMHQAIATVHKETAAVLRVEAKRIAKKR